MIKPWRERLDAHNGYVKDGQYLMGNDAIQAAMKDQIHELSEHSALLQWLAENPSIEIGDVCEEDDRFRTVHRVCGSVNDREYILLAKETDLLDALRVARSKMKG